MSGDDASQSRIGQNIRQSEPAMEKLGFCTNPDRHLARFRWASTTLVDQ
jgi:hypothetical protein